MFTLRATFFASILAEIKEICLRKAPKLAVSHSRLIRAVSLFVLKNEAFPTYTAFNCVLSKKKSEVYFPLSALEMNCFTSWLKEWAILHVSLQGSKNEAYFVYAALV